MKKTPTITNVDHEELVKRIQKDVQALRATAAKTASKAEKQAAIGQPKASAPSYTTVDGDAAATHVFIDDKRTPGDVQAFGLPEDKEWRILKSYAEFDKYLTKHGIPEFVSFDFNLDHEKTGHDCAKLLVQRCLEKNMEKLPGYMYHGDLESGRIIESYLMFYGKHKRIYKAKEAKVKTDTAEGE